MWIKTFAKGIGIASGVAGSAVVCNQFLPENRKFSVLNAAIKISNEDSISTGPPPPTPWAKWDFNWDRRQPESLVRPKKLDAADTPDAKQILLDEKKAKASRNIILIRHGQYNLEGAGDVNRYLTKLGREEAKETGKRLAQLGIKFDKLIYSTMTRATETANLIRESLPADLEAKSDSLLEEGAPYPPEPPISHWRPEAKEFLIDGARIEAGYRRYFHRADPKQEKDSTEVVVCHGNVIRYFVCRALQIPPEVWLRISLAHCSMTWICIRPNGRVILKSLGDTGHLPPDMVTFS